MSSQRQQNTRIINLYEQEASHDFAQIIEKIYQEHTEIFLDEGFKLESSGLNADYDQFICNVFRTHQTHRNILHFLSSLRRRPSSGFSTTAREARPREGEEESHPDLLLALIEGAGLGEHIETLKQPRSRYAKTVCEPLLYGSPRVFAAMLEF